MIKLKNPIPLTSHMQEGLEKNKNLLLFSTNRSWFIIIRDYKIEDKIVIKKFWSWFKQKEIEKKDIFLTEIDIIIWNSYRNNWAALTEPGVNLLLSYDTNLFKLRSNYLNEIKAPLEYLGVQFKTKNIDE